MHWPDPDPATSGQRVRLLRQICRADELSGTAHFGPGADFPEEGFERMPRYENRDYHRRLKECCADGSADEAIKRLLRTEPHS